MEVEQRVEIKLRAQKMVVRTQPDSNGVLVIAVDRFMQAVVVDVLSCDDQKVTNVVASSTISLQDAPKQTDLYGTLNENFKDGTATFSNLFVPLPGRYTLKFAYNGYAIVSNALSASFEVGTPVSKLALEVSPEGAYTAGEPFSIQPSVRLLDAESKLVLGATRPVEAAIASDAGYTMTHLPGALFGSTPLLGKISIQPLSGVAKFTNLMIQKASVGQGTVTNGYTLKFAVDAFNSLSQEFFIVPAAWTGLHVPFYAQPTTSRAGDKLAVQPQVFLVDRFFNRILPSQVPQGTVVNISISEKVKSNSGIQATLLKDSCRRECCDSECTDDVPQVCRTCPVLPSNASSAGVAYTDLRIDVSYTAYTLVFNSSDGHGNVFSVRSNAFEVMPRGGFGMGYQVPGGLIFADQEIAQPSIIIVDRDGKLATDISFL
jgi:hypothetical protein